jgi:dTDP-4-amino-4,6-dideoxygalactose transaminase
MFPAVHYGDRADAVSMNASDAISTLETRLATLLGRKHCVVTGRGATAIYLALRSLDRAVGKVVLPAVVCPSPASVSLYAGFEPVFCDIGLADFNLDPAALVRVLDTYPDVVAVMPVHLYGQAASMDEIAAIARARGLPVIEDAAQAFGGSYGDRPLGSLGDISIISFGHTKTLDTGWGGAALTDDDTLAGRMRAERMKLPGCPSNIDAFYAEYRRVYYALKPLADANPRLDELFLPLPGLFRDMHLFTLNEARVAPIHAALDRLPELVAARRAHARHYRAELASSGLHLPRFDAGAAPWRFSFLAGPGRAAGLTAALRAEGIDASNWYPALHRWYAAGRTQDENLFPNATCLAREVVNLWVEPRLTATQVERTCALIRRHLQPAVAA